MSNLQLFLGSARVQSARCWNQNAPILSRLISCVHARFVVHHLLAKAYALYAWSKLGHLRRSFNLDNRIRCVYDTSFTLTESHDAFLPGLMTLLNEDATVGLEILIPLIAGIGIGMLFHAPYEVFLHALKPSELATGTSAFFLVRFTGATIGLVRLHF